MINPGSELVTMKDQNSVESEAFRMLATNLLMRDFDEQIKIINVISANSGEGKSTVSLNLANVFSQMKKKVLLIDLDLKLPSIHKKLGVQNKVGITDVMAGRANLSDALIKINQNFLVLLSGSTIPFSSEFVQSKKLQNFLSKSKEIVDIIIIDTPPINIVADSMIVSKHCDGTLLCVSCNRNEKKELIRLKDRLENMKINILGIVITKMPSNIKRYVINKTPNATPKLDLDFGENLSFSITKLHNKNTIINAILTNNASFVSTIIIQLPHLFQ